MNLGSIQGSKTGLYRESKSYFNFMWINFTCVTVYNVTALVILMWLGDIKLKLKNFRIKICSKMLA